MSKCKRRQILIASHKTFSAKTVRQVVNATGIKIWMETVFRVKNIAVVSILLYSLFTAILWSPTAINDRLADEPNIYLRFVLFRARPNTGPLYACE